MSISSQENQTGANIQGYLWFLEQSIMYCADPSDMREFIPYVFTPFNAGTELPDRRYVLIASLRQAG